MTDITDFISGTNRDLYVTLIDNQAVPDPVVLTLCTSIAWEVFKGNTLMLHKDLDDGITITDDLNGAILIELLAVDTAPEADVSGTLYNANYYGAGLPGPILGSTTRTLYYKHETRLVFSDSTQEVPGSFRGYLVLDPTKTWGSED